MSKRRRTVEILKTLVIVILSISALLMLLQVQPFFEAKSNPIDTIKSIVSSIRNDAYNASNEASNITDGANTPLQMAYVSSGGRCVLQYSINELESNYISIATLLGEAIGSANQLRETDEAEWREKLSDPGVYLDYMGAIPIEVLAGWVGAQAPDDFPQVSIRRLLLIKRDDSADLYFRDEISEKYYACRTEVRFADIVQALDDTMVQNGGAFAFELGTGYENIDPYTLLSGESARLSCFSIASTLQSVEAQKRLMLELGFNPDSEARYEEGDGTNVIVESDAVLRFSASGNVQYRGTAGSMNAQFSDEEDMDTMITWARNLLVNCAGEGEQYAYLVSAKRDGNTMTIRFAWSLHGVPLLLNGDKYAMSVTVVDGTVTNLEMNLRSCVQTDTSAELLPESLAAAAVTNNGEMMINYGEDGIPFWVAE